MKKLLSVLLSLCILLTPLMSLAQGSLWLELEAGDVEARLEAGLDREGWPRLHGAYGGMDAGLSRQGILLHYNDFTMGATYKTLLQTLLMHFLELDTAPDLTPQDLTALLSAVGSYLEGLPEDAFSCRQTLLADGRTRTEILLQPRELCRYTDKAVASLLAGENAQVKAFLLRQKDVICRLAGLPEGSTDVCDQLLSGWRQLGLSSLLKEEYPLTITLTGDGDPAGRWDLEAGFLSYELKASSDQWHVSGHVLADGVRYPFDSEDVLFLLTELKAAAMEALRQEFFCSSVESAGRQSIRVEFSLRELAAAFFGALQRSTAGQTERWDALFSRNAPWLKLAGLEPDGLNSTWLLMELETYRSRMQYSWNRHAYLYDGLRLDLSVDAEDVLPLRLDAEALGFRLSADAGEDRFNAELTDGYDSVSLRGVMEPEEMVITYTETSGSWSQQHELLLRIQGSEIHVRLTDDDDDTLLTGTITANGADFQGDGFEGRITWSDQELHFRLSLPEDRETYTADAVLLGDTLYVDAYLNGWRLKGDAGPGGFSLSAGGWQCSGRLHEDGTLQISAQFNNRRAVNRYELKLSRDGLNLQMNTRRFILLLEADSNGAVLDYTGYGNAFRAFLTRQPGGDPDRMVFKVLVIPTRSNQSDKLYEGLLTVSLLEQGLKLRLTSEAHEPYGLGIGLSDEPMHFDGEESCGWLKPEALYQFVQLYLQMQ